MGSEATWGENVSKRSNIGRPIHAFPLFVVCRLAASGCLEHGRTCFRAERSGNCAAAPAIAYSERRVQAQVCCDFFTVETATLETVYVLFSIELGSRHVHLAGCTPTPNSVWVSQQARQFTWTLVERTPPMRFLIHDRDAKFSRTFDTVFQGQGIAIIHTPFQAPKANAFAQRWVRSVREECLDQLLVLNQRHLRRVLTE